MPTNPAAAYSGTQAITLAANGAIWQDNTNGATLSGVISGGVVTGPGNLILSGSTNNFGGTVVEAGMLTVTTRGAISNNEALTIDAGGTLVFDPGLHADSLAALSGETAAPAGGVSPVPEPGTLAPLGAALWSALIYCRFRRRSTTR